MQHGSERQLKNRYINGTEKNNPAPLSSPQNDEEALALRWRNAILRLTEDFSDAADQRDDLSPILMGALHNALERLLLRGEEDDLVMLEEWLRMEEAPGEETSPHKATGSQGTERRSRQGRRAQIERRSGRERRDSVS